MESTVASGAWVARAGRTLISMIGLDLTDSLHVRNDPD